MFANRQSLIDLSSDAVKNCSQGKSKSIDRTLEVCALKKAEDPVIFGVQNRTDPSADEDAKRFPSVAQQMSLTLRSWLLNWMARKGSLFCGSMQRRYYYQNRQNIEEKVKKK